MAAQDKPPENSLRVLDDFETLLLKNGETNKKTNGRNNQPKANNVQSSSTGKEFTHHNHKENNVREGELPEHNRLSSGKQPHKRPFNKARNRIPSSNAVSASDVKENVQREQHVYKGERRNAPQSSQCQSQNTDGKKFPQKKAKGLNKVTKPMDFKGLHDLLDKEPGYIITSLANPKLRFHDLANNHPLRPDMLRLIVQVLSRVTRSEVHQLKIKVLSETMTPEMMDEINRYAQSICMEDDQHKLKSVESFFRDTLKVFETCISCFPSSIMNEKFKSVLVSLNLSMKYAKENQGISISDGTFDTLKDVTEHVSSHVENSQRIDQEKSKNATFRETKAPNNFRDMEIVPTKEDFMCQKAFLRKNIVQGSYRNCEEYLDVQFRLLREDFIDPLRTGIFEYLDSVHTPNFKQKISNVRIYPKVQFIETSRDRLGFRINFDIERKIPKNVNWEFNKRFKVGSLLLLTQNDFKQFFLATVIDRSVQQLYCSILTVAFVPGTEKPKEVFGPDVFFLMAESEVYYEAYRPVLSALQRMTKDTFPMTKYIVDVITDSIPPKHLRIESKYTVEHHEVDILDESSWPSPDELKLNHSQHQAFKAALTNEFAVIQGPPGTGKTFLALKITEVLLKNGVSKRTPIVVICYTNHALDQFLEGILKQTENLIRIGSQSQNEALEKYNIGVVRKEKKEKKQLNLSDLYRLTVSKKCDLKGELDYLKRMVAEISSPNGILELSTLKSIIPPYQYVDLEHQIVDWLFFEDCPNWFHEATQAASCTEEILGSSSDPEAQETEKPKDDLEDDEDEEEENTRRLADLMEDDFLPDEDMTEKVNIPRVAYSFHLQEAYGELDRLIAELLECRKSQTNQYHLFYHEQNLIEKIQQMRWKINHFNFEATKFQQFQFDGGKLAKLQVLQVLQSVWDIEPSVRWEYYWSWVHLYSCRLNQKVHLVTNSYQDVMMELDEARQFDDAEFVRKADVVGLTTSGAAKRRVLLENLATEIVIVEEAAEVLEAHIVTALAPSVQHVILIGDHKQLKPNPAVYDLARKFNLDISLFERMLNNGMGCSVLNVQHRMRPESASLICPTIYPDLQNHPSTYDRAKISGIDKFVFFLNHNHPEDQLPDSTSRQNKFEADFLIELCQYLMRNGYQPQEITILATYFGQVWYLRQAKKRLSKNNPAWHDVRITPVDNFQGEENKIILLSLVRSNKDNRIGFLSTENRVCVALSRARDGLYIVGNMDNLTASSAIWPKIHDQLQQVNAIGNALTLRCERHPEQVTLASSAQHISAIPDGGCALMCEFKLSCGHVCPRVCHIIDKEHAFYECLEPCERPPCPVEGHKCPLDCFKQCQPCQIPMDKLLPCGHTKSLPCHVEPASATCLELIPARHPDCDHSIEKLCSMDITKCKCPEKCPLRLPCGHACERTCHVKDDIDHIKYKCMKACDKQNPKCRREHKCPKQCYQECGDCVVLVQAELPCGHRQEVECHVDESSIVCAKPCKKLLPCGHKCLLQCSKPCNPSLCIQKVDKEGPCGHIFNNMKCNERFDKRKCHQPCSRSLSCGHPCTDKCFKDCTKVVCKVLVESEVAPACGHPPVKIACHLNKPDMNPGCDLLLQQCEVKCEAQLACGHVCEGSCGRCMNGRLHQPCQQQCTKRLICGHMCSAKCCKLCPPCLAKECFSNCVHQRCASSVRGKKSHCSTPCDPCTKPCVWACPHQQCTRQCGEVCNRTVCDEPCPLLLTCGHVCAGYCGEVCPPICLTCNSDEIFIDNLPDARFVLLEDCNHTVEASLLAEMTAATTKPCVGALLLCPTCSHPIVKTKRCRDVYIRFSQKYKQIQDKIRDEQQRFMKGYSILQSYKEKELTCSALMNNFLQDCYKKYIGSTFNKILIVSMLGPIIRRYLRLKRSEELSDETEQQLRSRLDYLALCLRPRGEFISQEDIVQIELEATRIYRLLSESSNLDWYNVKPYTWEQDMITRQTMTLPPTSISVNLKTRDFAKKWFECDRQHLYVSNVGDPCHVCEEERRKLKQEQLEALQKQQQQAQRNQARNQASNLEGHQVMNQDRNKHGGGNHGGLQLRNQGGMNHFGNHSMDGRNQSGNHNENQGRNRNGNHFGGQRYQGRKSQ